jgi:mannose-1-phosphate guanylyltransferase / phosphomannomutase
LAVLTAIVLAAGEGTRLRPLTSDRPKALVEVAGIPLLDHSLSLLAQHGVQHVTINLHYLPEAIVELVGDGSVWGLTVQYLHEPQLLGSGGTLRALADGLRETFFLLYGDVLTNADLTALAQRHADRKAALTCLLHAVPDPWTKGVADLRADGRLLRFVEKPRRGEEPGNLVAAGVYVVDPELLAVIPDRLPCDFGGDVVPAALGAGLPLYGVTAAPGTYACDIGTHAALAAAHADVAAGRMRMLRRYTGS